MTLQDRIAAFASLGKRLSHMDEESFEELAWRVQNNNNWFRKSELKEAINGLIFMLQEDKLQKWVSNYTLAIKSPKVVGLMMAGNIPAIGFHDMLSILIAGHRLKAKLSSTDTILPVYLMDELVKIEPRFAAQYQFADMLKEVDAIIATGSDNSARYFEYYFNKYPHIIRKNRSSVAILTGAESTEELTALGKDIFLYYGLGCRNVSKLYLAKDFPLPRLLDALASYEHIADNHKYNNNYDYNKSIYLVNGIPHLDNGFLLLKEDEHLVSPISVVFYEYYDDQNDLANKLALQKEKIQCIVAQKPSPFTQTSFGEAQTPELWDYADGVDTLVFLENL